MNILYVTKGEKLKKKQHQLVVVSDALEHNVDLETVSCIIIEQPQCSITCDVMIMCSDHNVPIVICNRYGVPQVYCHDFYEYHHLTSRLHEQILWNTKDIRLEIQQHIITAKIKHQLQLLQLMQPTSKDNLKLEQSLIKMESTITAKEIDAIEAYSAKVYFKALFGSDFTREDDSLVNACLNYGYAIQRSIIMSVVVTKGLHPSLAMWHRSQFNNYNLADDFIEVYRPMVDYVALLLANNAKEFDKDCKLKLQQVILQEVIVNMHEQKYRYSVELFVDSVIHTFNTGNVYDLVIPSLSEGLYEY